MSGDDGDRLDAAIPYGHMQPDDAGVLQHCHSLLDYYLPLITDKCHTTDKPWVTIQFRHLIRCRQYALKTGQTARYKVYRKCVQRMSRTLQQKCYARKMEGLCASNPRSWWQSIKQIAGQAVNTTQPLIVPVNQLHDSDVQALVDSANRFFQSMAGDLSPLDDDSTLTRSDVVPDEFVISLEDLKRKLRQINIHKAPEPNGLPNWLLRDFSSDLASPVCAIYNASVHEGFVPSWWKKANVVPVPKVQPPRAIRADLHTEP